MTSNRAQKVYELFVEGDLIFDAWRDDRQIFVFGNGGSAYNASHHVCDYVKTATADGARPLRAISLNDNIGISTAVGNDIGYEDVFRYPLSAYARTADRFSNTSRQPSRYAEV